MYTRCIPAVWRSKHSWTACRLGWERCRCQETKSIYLVSMKAAWTPTPESNPLVSAKHHCRRTGHGQPTPHKDHENFNRSQRGRCGTLHSTHGKKPILTEEARNVDLGSLSRRATRWRKEGTAWLGHARRRKTTENVVGHAVQQEAGFQGQGSRRSSVSSITERIVQNSHARPRVCN